MLCWITAGGTNTSFALENETSGELKADGLEQAHSLRLSADFAEVELNATDATFSGSWTADPINRPPDGQSAGIPALPPAAPVTIVNDGELLVRAQNSRYRYHLKFQIPRGWDVTVQIYRRGDVRVIGMDGAVTAWSAGGEVSLLQQTGAFSITAMDGNASVDFAGGALKSASAISAHVPTLKDHGIKLAIPASLAVELRMSTTGEVHTDLPQLMGALTQANARGDVWPLSVTLNGGGPLISLRDVNGDIEIKAHD